MSETTRGGAVVFLSHTCLDSKLKALCHIVHRLTQTHWIALTQKSNEDNYSVLDLVHSYISSEISYAQVVDVAQCAHFL